MQGWYRILLGLAVAALTAASTLSKQTRRVQDAVDFFNNASVADYVFKLVEFDAGYGLNVSIRPPQLRFTLKETECLKSENKTVEECDIREGGITKVCSLDFLVEMERNTIMINCNSSIQKGTRERRWIWPFKRKKKPKSGAYSSIASGKVPGSGGRGTILAK
ncbi:15 kDa protein B-like [Lissotriton helveticus]